METNEVFLTDKPINDEQYDMFQRYGFSKRIAETIATQKSPDSIIIGLFGAWGEGKTSVLNFIKNELKTMNSDISFFTFNPWRFSDEATILYSFFNSLAETLQKAIDKNSKNEDNNTNRTFWKKKKGSLKTTKETIGEIIKEYGKLASFIGGAKETAEAIGQSLAHYDIEELRERIRSD